MLLKNKITYPQENLVFIIDDDTRIIIIYGNTTTTVGIATECKEPVRNDNECRGGDGDFHLPPGRHQYFQRRLHNHLFPKTLNLQKRKLPKKWWIKPKLTRFPTVYTYTHYVFMYTYTQ